MVDNPLTLVQTIVPAVSGLLGVGIGAWINAYVTDKRERQKQRHDFQAKQIAELYGPLVALHHELQARAAIRDRIIDTAVEVREQVIDAGRLVGREELRRLHADELPGYDAVANMPHQGFVDMLLPTYQAIRDLYREKLWLAEPDTRAHFPPLLEFVSLWEWYLDQKPPGRIMLGLKHSSKKLEPVFDHLHQEHERLRKDLSR